MSCGTVYSLVSRPHPLRGEGSGDIGAISWLCKLSIHVTKHNEFYGVGVQDQEIAPMSPDPSPHRGWGLGTRLDSKTVYSLASRPHSLRGKGSGVYRALSWAFRFYESGDFL